jgi:HD-GYP domain-containing protein (c-di-GMP phosphodiesterase class II)
VAIEGIARDVTERKLAEEALVTAAERLRTALLDTVRAMGAIMDLRDPYTGDHQRRVSRLADAIALEMGLGEAVREGLMMAANVHDLGKIETPAELLSKPAVLTDVELALVRRHASTGQQILTGIAFEAPIATIVGQHHERLDGSGYPEGLRGDDLLLESRILAVADVVEAMSSHRPYRPALGLEVALQEVRDGAGTRYDAAVVAAVERIAAGGLDLSA